MLAARHGMRLSAVLLVTVALACSDPPPSSSDTLADALADTPAPPDFVPASSGTLVDSLPASYTCADCSGVQYHLNLLADRSFFLRRTDRRSGGDVADDIGTWALTRGRSAIVLSSGGRALESLGVGDERGLLREAGGVLVRSDAFEPLDMSVRVRALVDAEGGFAECATGRMWSVVPGSDLDAEYRSARPLAGGRVLTEVRGRVVTDLVGGAVTPRLTVEQIVGVQVSATCTPPSTTRSLARTTWTLSELFGQRVSSTGVAEPARLEFDQADFSAWDGCNRLLGSFHQDGARLEFSVSLATGDACPDAAPEGETFRSALNRVRSWRIVGEALALFDPDDILVARFDAR